MPNNELNQPWSLVPHQRTVLQTAFSFDTQGRLPWDTLIYPCPKKSGKTTLNAAIVIWWAFTQESPNEILILSNDFEQASSRVFSSVTRLIKNNRLLAMSAEVQMAKITLSNGTTIIPLATEYASAAGSNHGLTSFDELWGYASESSRRLWEELTPVPTRKNSIRFITTYAGWEGESQLLFDLYKQGVSQMNILMAKANGCTPISRSTRTETHGSLPTGTMNPACPGRPRSTEPLKPRTSARTPIAACIRTTGPRQNRSS